MYAPYTHVYIYILYTVARSEEGCSQPRSLRSVKPVETLQRAQNGDPRLGLGGGAARERQRESRGLKKG